MSETIGSTIDIVVSIDSFGFSCDVSDVVDGFIDKDGIGNENECDVSLSPAVVL